MIFGVGIDLIEIDRFANQSREELAETFTVSELDYCFSKRYPERHLAGRFAAKEAFLKALGSGALIPVEFSMVEVENEPTGNPMIRLYGNVAERAASLQIGGINLSITHTSINAAAVVVLERLSGSD